MKTSLIHRVSASLALAFLLLGLSHAANQAPVIHAFNAGESAIFVNAYVIDTGTGLVVVDSTLTESSSKSLKATIDKLGKPIHAVIVTHGHPDHYNGLTNVVAGTSIPVYSTQETLDVIKASDAAKEKQWKPVFGAEWPTKRTFPNKTVRDGQTLTFDGVRFTVHAMGPAESHADSIWLMSGNGVRAAFVGDMLFNGVHSYLCDGHTALWLAALDRLDATLKRARIALVYPGHGSPGDLTLIEHQREYLRIYRDEIRVLAADGQLSESDLATLKQKLESATSVKGIDFLVSTCAAPVAAELGLALEPNAKP